MRECCRQSQAEGVCSMQQTAGTKFTKPGVHLLAEPCRGRICKGLFHSCSLGFSIRAHRRGTKSRRGSDYVSRTKYDPGEREKIGGGGEVATLLFPSLPLLPCSSCCSADKVGKQLHRTDGLLYVCPLRIETMANTTKRTRERRSCRNYRFPFWTKNARQARREGALILALLD